MTTDKFIKTRQKAHWIAFFKYLHREHYCKPLICGHRRKWDVFWYVFSQGFTIFTPPAVPPFLFTQLAHIWKLKRTHLKLPFGDYDIPVIRLSIRVWAHAVVLWALCAHGLCDHIKYSENSFSDFFFGGHLIKITDCSRNLLLSSVRAQIQGQVLVVEAVLLQCLYSMCPAYCSTCEQ